MPLRTFIDEFKRRRVFRVAVVYGVVGWLIIQFTLAVFPQLNLPEWTARFVVILVLIGFPVAMVLAWAFELTPDGMRLTHHVDRQHVDQPHVDQQDTRAIPAAHWGWKRHALAYAAVVLISVLVAFAGFRWLQSDDPGSTGPGKIPTIAVLPLESLNSDEESLALTGGLHDALISQLAKLGSLAVVSRTSVMQYEGKRPSIAQVAKELAVDVVLEGTVQRQNQRLRITAQLIDARTDKHLWTEIYEQRALYEACSLRLPSVPTARP